LLSLLLVLVGSLAQGVALMVSYIANHTFPLPLSEREEKCYLDKLSNGDESAKQVLIERNLRLVAHIVKKFDNTGEDMDDLISIGTIGLIKAISTFNLSKKTRLATYAARCIENEILMHLRTTRRIRTEVSLYDPIGVDKEGNEFPSFGYLCSSHLGKRGYNIKVKSSPCWCFSFLYVVYSRTDFSILFFNAGSDVFL